MNRTDYQIEIRRVEREQLTLDDLATHTGAHPILIERFVEYGLIEPSQRAGAQMFFDVDCIVRVRKIQRLRHDLGTNLPSVAVILDLLDRMRSLETEIERLRRFAP